MATVAASSKQRAKKATRKPENTLQGPVLVTGALGFIGRHLVNRLLDEGLGVIAFDVPGTRKLPEWDKQVTLIHGDIADQNDVTKAVAKARTIVHLAAVVGDWGADALHQRVTVDGTRILFDAALGAANKPRVLLVSSIVVYGDQIGAGACNESMVPGKTFGPYSRSKQAQERLAMSYFQRGLPLSIVRPANVYGAGSKPWVDDLGRELKRGSPALIGGGNFNAGLVHVNNVVEVIVRVLQHPDTLGQIFNAADEEGITWKQYCTDIAALVGAPQPRSIPRVIAEALAAAGEFSFRRLHIKNRPPLTHEALNLVGAKHDIRMDKAREMLGYTPVTSYSEGVEEIRRYLSKGER